MSQIDLNILSDKEINDDCNGQLLSECKSVHRMITGLIYYQVVNEKNKSTTNDKNKETNYGRDVFNNLISQQYQHYLDDIIHFNTKHQNHLEEIHDTMLIKHPDYKPCDVNSCIATNRHCQMYYEDGKGTTPYLTSFQEFATNQ